MHTRGCDLALNDIHQLQGRRGPLYYHITRQGCRTLAQRLGPRHQSSVVESVKVPCIDLSQWIRNHCSSTDDIVVKLDIEGAEYQVLQRMLDTGVAQWVRFYYIEWHAHMTGNEKLLEHERQIRQRFAELKIKYRDWD